MVGWLGFCVIDSLMNVCLKLATPGDVLMDLIYVGTYMYIPHINAPAL